MEKRFGDRELERILEDATNLPEASRPARPERLRVEASDGLTLAEIKRIAEEAGIEAWRIERAVQKLLAGSRSSPLDLFLGGPSALRLQSEYGLVLDEAAAGDALHAVREAMSVHGSARAMAGGVEWTSTDELGGRYVAISRTPRGTRVDVRGDFGNAARGGAAIGAAVAGAGALGVVAATASIGVAGLALVPLVAAGAVVLPRLTVGRLVARERRRLHEAAGRVSRLIADRSDRGGDGEV